MSKKGALITIFVSALVAALSFYYAYSRFDINKDIVPNSYAAENGKENKGQINDSKLPETVTEESLGEEETSPAMTEEKITGSTKMVYQYYYTEDGNTVEQEDIPPYFLIGMTFSDMKEYYPNWQIVYFSEDKVIMRKEVEVEAEENYMVGNMDGYVAVFYDNGEYGMSLKTVTETPLASLTKEERERLDEGIFVSGEEALARILESYES